jgi:hypothetical protein
MRRPATLFTIVLALGAIVIAASASAKEGATEIEKCQTVSKPGSYKLVNNLTFSGTMGTCLSITTDFVTIDLSGFTISGPGNPAGSSTAIGAENDTRGIAVRNGSISGFAVGVALGDGSTVDGLHVSGGFPSSFGIIATGIVKGNTVFGVVGPPGTGIGIFATGIVTGNYVTRGRFGIEIGQGSTVIGNTAVNSGAGMSVSCPSNVTDNTAVSIQLNGEGCHSEDNVPPP